MRISREGIVVALVVTGTCVPVAAQREAAKPWSERAVESQVGRYTIVSDLPPTQTTFIGRRLNLLYETFQSQLPEFRLRQTESLTALLFSDRQDFSLTLASRFVVNAGDEPCLYATGTEATALLICVDNRKDNFHQDRESFAGRPRLHASFQREAFRQFLVARFGKDLPPWVETGLGEWFGRSVFTDNQLLSGQATPAALEALINAIELDALVSLDRFTLISRDEWAKQMASPASSPWRDQAWSMVAFLLTADGGRYRDAFHSYLRKLNSAVPDREAFEASFGKDRRAFEQQWKRFVVTARPGAFVTAIERMEFLAKGLLKLQRTGDYPESLESLRDSLREIGFLCTIPTARGNLEVQADDDELFTIPSDAASPQQPVFLVEPYRMTQSSTRERQLEDATPTPAVVSTQYLRPRNLKLEWIRNEVGDSFTFRVVLD